MVLPVFAYVLQLLIPAEWFPHIECILAFFSTSRVVAVVIDYSSEDTIAIARVLINKAWVKILINEVKIGQTLNPCKAPRRYRYLP